MHFQQGSISKPGDLPISVGIVGCGPTALYLLKHLVESKASHLTLTFFHATGQFGSGMPYNAQWVGHETLANIACEEIPDLEQAPHEWIKSLPEARLSDFGLEATHITPQFIPTRAMLGEYFAAQFDMLLARAARVGIGVRCFGRVTVDDVVSTSKSNTVVFYAANQEWPQALAFDYIIVATGHQWPESDDSRPRFQTSPWPISKLESTEAQNIGLIGSSLSAVDTCLALARKHGRFYRDYEARLRYAKDLDSKDFSVTMHSRRGMLPPVRCFFEFPRFELHQYISKAELRSHIRQNDHHLSLDYLFETVLKKIIEEKSPDLFEIVRSMTFEDFVSFHLERCMTKDPFALLEQEFLTSFSSIANHVPIFWREALDDVTYTLNFYNRYLDLKDVRRVRHLLMPLISHVVAVLPQQSCEQLLAMHHAGCLRHVTVNDDLEVLEENGDPHIELVFTDPQTEHRKGLSYDLVVDCRGQRTIACKDFPFRSMLEAGIVSPAKISATSQDGEKHCDALELLGGIDVDESFHPISTSGIADTSIFVIAAPLIGGLYPYHSGLPFCNEVAKTVASQMLGASAYGS